MKRMVAPATSASPLRGLREPARLRDWGFFALAALLPALAVGLLGLRALRNEEAALRRETAAALDASAERTSLELHQALATATSRLAATPLDGDPGKALAQVRALAPPFAEPILLGPDRAPLQPAQRGRDAPAPERCGELAAALRKRVSEPPRGRDAAVEPTLDRATARAEILAACQEARGATGRWLWPMVALDGLTAAEAPALVAWLEGHAARLGEAERAVTAEEIGATAALAPADRARALGALEGGGGRFGSVAAELRQPGVAAVLRRGPRAGEELAWRSGTSTGVVRGLADGRSAGFLVHRASLAEAVTIGWPPLPADQRAVVATPSGDNDATTESTGASAATTPTRATRGAAELSAVVAVAPRLELRLVVADLGALEARASRSRAVLAALAVAATGLAFAVAGILFARMRAARRASELRTDFVSTVSHELRTPIASIRMLAELLEQDRVEEGERAEVHEALAREAKRLGDTVDRLLGFGRMAAGRMVVERRLGRVAAPVAESVDTFEERHPEQAPVERDLDEAAFALVDAGQLRLAVDNLLANARKYAPDGTPYRVTVRREGERIEVRVADRGPGIARRDQRRIFEPFERVDDRLSRATEGSGIGLSLVRHVARAHGGDAWVDSEPGHGATFVMSLPAHEPPAERDEPAPTRNDRP